MPHRNSLWRVHPDIASARHELLGVNPTRHTVVKVAVLRAKAAKHPICKKPRTSLVATLEKSALWASHEGAVLALGRAVVVPQVAEERRGRLVGGAFAGGGAIVGGKDV